MGSADSLFGSGLGSDLIIPRMIVFPQMGDYPYITVQSSLKEFLDQVPKTGTPEKLVRTELEARGFKSKNDRPIIPLLRFIGFIDKDGVPTGTYTNFKDRKQSGVVMADAIKQAYSDLFSLYPGAQSVDNDDLASFFSTRTKGGERVVEMIVSTFRTLCEFASFGDEVAGPEDVPPSGVKSADSAISDFLRHKPKAPVTSHSVVNVNLQVVLPTTEDSTVYDRIFESIKKHLLA